MIDHITLNVSDLEKSKEFYAKVLTELGMRVNLGSTEQSFWGFGVDANPEFEIAPGRFFIGQSDDQHPVAPSVHVAFRAKDHNAVIAFYRAALAAGGRDNGAPGLRPEYTATYFAAFILDPDGNNIEAVCL